MSGTGTAAAVLLAVAFAVAGTGKLRSPGTATTFQELQLPAPRLLAVAVPLAELALAGLLVIRPATGGAAALLLLAVFSAVLARSMRAGRHVRCGCFGSAGDELAGPLHLVRNALLGCLALAALAAGRPTMPGVADLVLVSTGASAASLGFALARLHEEVGAVWATVLPGELAGETRNTGGAAQ